MKKLTAVLLAVGMLLCGASDTAFAQKGGSSSGSSRPGSSSGSSSGSRPGSSYSSGGGKGYSSGGSSTTGKPATSGGGGSSYSSGNGKGYSSGGSSSSSNPPEVSGSGGKSYSSGGSSTPSKPSVTQAPPPVKGTTPGSSYTTGNKTYTPVANPSGSTKPKSGAFDGNAAQAKQREESKAAYVKGAEPKSTYTTPAGKEAKIDTSSKSVTTVRSMSHTTYVTRETRIYSTYSPYYGRPVVIYNDPYNSFFWYWMLDRSLEERAMWAYHHQHEMDAARYRELCAKDAQLEARIRQLEAQNKGVRDVSYTPKGIDPDLQYSDDFVDAAYNPYTEHDNTPPPSHHAGGGGGGGVVLYYIFLTLLVGVVIWAVIYLVFLKNW